MILEDKSLLKRIDQTREVEETELEATRLHKSHPTFRNDLVVDLLSHGVIYDLYICCLKVYNGILIYIYIEIHVYIYFFD